MSELDKKKGNSFVNFIKRYFFTGLLISAPIGATIYITIFIVEFIAGLVPQRFNPNGLLPEIIGYEIPGLELISIAVPEDSSIIGQALEDIELPPHSFIAIVMKDNRAEPPIDKLIIEAHDEIVAVTTPDEEAVMYDILTGVL